jgi:hypothetical protein
VCPFIKPLAFYGNFKLSFKEKWNGNQMWLWHNRATQQRAKGIKESTCFYYSSKEGGNFMRVLNLRDTWGNHYYGLWAGLILLGTYFLVKLLFQVKFCNKSVRESYAAQLECKMVKFFKYNVMLPIFIFKKL